MLSGFVSLVDKVEKSLSDKDNLKVLNTLLLVECKHNFNLISCLNFDKLNQFDNEIFNIIELLEDDILKIYLSDKIKTVTLIGKLIDKNKDKTEEESEDLIVNIYLKIKIFKSIRLLCNNENNGLKKFRLKLRLKNLRDKLIELIKVLEKKTN